MRRTPAARTRRRRAATRRTFRASCAPGCEVEDRRAQSGSAERHRRGLEVVARRAGVRWGCMTGGGDLLPREHAPKDDGGLGLVALGASSRLVLIDSTACW